MQIRVTNRAGHPIIDTKGAVPRIGERIQTAGPDGVTPYLWTVTRVVHVVAGDDPHVRVEVATAPETPWFEAVGSEVVVLGR